MKTDDPELAAIRERLANPANRWANEIQRDAETLLKRLDISEARLQGYIDMRNPAKGKLVRSQSAKEAKP